jgi:hypothetical protein
VTQSTAAATAAAAAHERRRRHKLPFSFGPAPVTRLPATVIGVPGIARIAVGARASLRPGLDRRDLCGVIAGVERAVPAVGVALDVQDALDAVAGLPDEVDRDVADLSRPVLDAAPL